jgi:hypothetical protein
MIQEAKNGKYFQPFELIELIEPFEQFFNAKNGKYFQPLNQRNEFNRSPSRYNSFEINKHFFY